MRIFIIIYGAITIFVKFFEWWVLVEEMIGGFFIHHVSVNFVSPLIHYLHIIMCILKV